MTPRPLLLASAPSVLNSFTSQLLGILFVKNFIYFLERSSWRVYVPLGIYKTKCVPQPLLRLTLSHQLNFIWSIHTSFELNSEHTGRLCFFHNLIGHNCGHLHNSPLPVDLWGSLIVKHYCRNFCCCGHHSLLSISVQCFMLSNTLWNIVQCLKTLHEEIFMLWNVACLLVKFCVLLLNKSS